MTEQTPETPDTTEEPQEPTAEQRRAELPGLGYSGKFDHGEESVEDPAEDETAEDGEPIHETPPSPSPATTTETTPPAPAAQPWTLGQNGGA